MLHALVSYLPPSSTSDFFERESLESTKSPLVIVNDPPVTD
jgi:hypothetical protein